ncbi:hypothetical protein EDB87DRAFT_1566519, partial [Lactarius vividus]
RTQNNTRIGAIAATYTSGILRYLMADALDLAGAWRSLPLVLTPLLIKVMRRNEPTEELDTLVRATIAGGGILHFIHKTPTVGKVKEAEVALA